MLNRREQALIACEKVVNGIEDETISVTSALLLCKKIARLVNDEEGQEWLDYEYGGYPRGEKGHIKSEAWAIAAKYGRSYMAEKNGEFHEYIFVELCGELEAQIESDLRAINNYTTQGFSVAGDYAMMATSNMTHNVYEATNLLRKSIKNAERNLAILKSQYYNYALKWQMELVFGNTSRTIFEKYQERIDKYYHSMPESILRKLSAIEENMSMSNVEGYSLVLTSCRRLWSEIAKYLFDKVQPECEGNTFMSKSGKGIDISGDHDNNKLLAVIETLQNKAVRNTIVGSEIIYLVDLIEQINKRQNMGVHSEVTMEEAEQCLIHTYIALGDIMSLYSEIEKGNVL